MYLISTRPHKLVSFDVFYRVQIKVVRMYVCMYVCNVKKVMLGSLHFHRNDYTGNIEYIVKTGFFSIKFTITFAGNVNL